LEPGEPDGLAFPLAFAGVAPVPERAGELVEAGVERFLGALGPPRGVLVLGRVPILAQRVQRPRNRRGEVVSGDAVGLLRFPLPEVRLHAGECPVERHPRRPGMGSQRALLRRGRVHRQPVGEDRHCGSSCPSAATARAARFAAARRPYSRAHRDVRISVTSRTRSSSTSDGSATASLRPCADSAASTYSAPNRANLSRCSTTITVTEGSRSSPRNLRRWPFSADPTSVTTRPTASPSPAAHAVTRATCRSRSDRWPAEETRAYTATSSAETGTGAASTRISRPARLAGTGSLPSRNQRYAVTGWTPCCSAHSFKFTHAFYCILTRRQLTSPQPGASGPRRKFWPKTVGTGTCGPLTREPAMTAGLWPTPQEPGGTDVRQLPPPACRSRKLREPPLSRAPREPGQSCCAHRPRGGPAGGRSYRRRPVGVQPGRAPPEPVPGSVRPGCRGPGPAGQFRQPVLWTACISDAHAVTRAGLQEGSPAGPGAARAR